MRASSTYFFILRKKLTLLFPFHVLIWKSWIFFFPNVPEQTTQWCNLALTITAAFKIQVSLILSQTINMCVAIPINSGTKSGSVAHRNYSSNYKMVSDLYQSEFIQKEIVFERIVLVIIQQCIWITVKIHLSSGPLGELFKLIHPQFL